MARIGVRSRSLGRSVEASWGVTGSSPVPPIEDRCKSTHVVALGGDASRIVSRIDLATAFARVGRAGYVFTGPTRRLPELRSSEDPHLLETSVPGIFACGDIRLSPVIRVAAAVGEGSMAIAFGHQYLKQAAAIAEPPAWRRRPGAA